MANKTRKYGYQNGAIAPLVPAVGPGGPDWIEWIGLR